MRYLIDTNICIYLMNQKPHRLIQKLKHFQVGDIGLSSITLAELQYGVSKSKSKRNNQIRLNEFLVPFEILPFDERHTITYGEIRSQLEKVGKIIGPLDLLIAAHALSEEFILITNNDKEFKRVKGLSVENWTK
jgi:tRNA(fMet)-specific endonuclease VapC